MKRFRVNFVWGAERGTIPCSDESEVSAAIRVLLACGADHAWMEEL